MRVNTETGEFESGLTCQLTSSGFMQGQLVQVYGLESVMPNPAAIPGTMGKGAVASNLPQKVGVTGAALSQSTVTAASSIPTWIWVLVFGIAAYIIFWRVFYRES